MTRAPMRRWLLLLPLLLLGQSYHGGAPHVGGTWGPPPVAAGNGPSAASWRAESGVALEADCSGNSSSCISAIIDESTDWTIEYFHKCDTGSPQWRSILTGSNGASSIVWIIQQETTSDFYEFDLSGADPPWSFDDTWGETSTWYHVAHVYKSAGDQTCTTGRTNQRECLYIDGVDQGVADRRNTSFTMSTNTNRWQIGFDGQYSDTANCWITELRVWNVARSEQQIQDHDQCQLNRVDDEGTTPTGLVAYWPLNEGTGTTANEVSGSGNNAAVDATDTAGSWSTTEKPTFTNNGNGDCYP